MPQLEAEVATRVMAHLAGRMGPKEIGEAVAFAVSELNLVSSPPSGGHRIYNIYAKKVDDTYHLMMELESVAEL